MDWKNWTEITKRMRTFQKQQLQQQNRYRSAKLRHLYDWIYHKYNVLQSTYLQYMSVAPFALTMRKDPSIVGKLGKEFFHHLSSAIVDFELEWCRSNVWERCTRTYRVQGVKRCQRRNKIYYICHISYTPCASMEWWITVISRSWQDKVGLTQSELSL